MDTELKKVTQVALSENEKTREDNFTFDDSLDVKKFTATVHSRIRDKIGSDFIMAKLEEKDKTFVMEMVMNAYFNYNILDMLSKRTNIKEEKEVILNNAKQLFDEHVTKIYMIALLNRNKPKNWLVGKMLDTTSEDEEAKEEEEQNKILNKLSSKLKKEET